MNALDSVNRKFRPRDADLAASGWRMRPEWAMNQKSLSPAYTSCWDQLLRVR